MIRKHSALFPSDDHSGVAQQYHCGTALGAENSLRGLHISYLVKSHPVFLQKQSYRRTSAASCCHAKQIRRLFSARAAQGASVSRIQMCNTMVPQPIRHFIHCCLHGIKLLFCFAVAIIDDLHHMVILRQPRYLIGKRPLRLRCTRQKKQRLFMFSSIF